MQVGFLLFMQQLQQQFLRKPEGNEALLAYQAAAFQGAMGGNNFVSAPGSSQMPQQPRKFMDMAQQHGSQEGQNRSQGVDQQVLNPVHQAYLQYAFQAAQQKSGLAMQSQQQNKMGMLGPPSGKDQDMRSGNLKMQEFNSMQAANQAQASSSKNLSSKNSLEHFSHGEKQMDQGQPPASDQRSESKPSAQPATGGQFMPGNLMRPMMAPQQSMQNMQNNQMALAAQLQAIALEHNIDLSQPNVMAQLIPIVQSRMAAQQKANESNMGAQSSSAPVSKQQVTSPQVANESSPRANSSSDVSGQSGSAKARQPVSPSPFDSGSNSAMFNNSNNIPMQQFSVHGRENQMPPRQSVPFGNGMAPTHPTHPSTNTSQGPDQSVQVKTVPNNPESSQMQYPRQLNRSSPQAVVPNDGGSGSAQSQGGPAPQVPQQRPGFTKQQLHVLKAQILAFRRIKVHTSLFPFYYFIAFYLSIRPTDILYEFFVEVFDNGA